MLPEALCAIGKGTLPTGFIMAVIRAQTRKALRAFRRVIQRRGEIWLLGLLPGLFLRSTARISGSNWTLRQELTRELQTRHSIRLHRLDKPMQIVPAAVIVMHVLAAVTD